MGKAIAIFIFLLNAFDGIATYYALTNLGAVELNPLVNWMYINMGVWFLVPKMALGLLVGILLWKYWKDVKISRVLGYVVLLFYAMLVVYQIRCVYANKI